MDADIIEKSIQRASNYDLLLLCKRLEQKGNLEKLRDLMSDNSYSYLLSYYRAYGWRIKQNGSSNRIILCMHIDNEEDVQLIKDICKDISLIYNQLFIAYHHPTLIRLCYGRYRKVYSHFKYSLITTIGFKIGSYYCNKIENIGGIE